MLHQAPITTAKTVLMIEDDRAISSAMEKLLIHYGYKVVVASTLAVGKTGLASRPDLVILDVQLPDGDGLDLLSQIRQSARGPKTFVLTATENAVTDLKLRRLKPDRYFRKPFNFIEILDAIRLALDVQPTNRPVSAF